MSRIGYGALQLARLRPEGDQVVGLDDQLATMTALRDAETLATLDAVESRTNNLPIGARS